MIKLYACKFCKKWTNRFEARECIKTHILVERNPKGKQGWVSNISKAMLRRNFNG